MRAPAAGSPQRSARPQVRPDGARASAPARSRPPGTRSPARLSRERVWTGGGAKLLGTDAVRTAGQEGTILGHGLAPITKLETSLWPCLDVFQAGMPAARKQRPAALAAPGMLCAQRRAGPGRAPSRRRGPLAGNCSWRGCGRERGRGASGANGVGRADTHLGSQSVLFALKKKKHKKLLETDPRSPG